VNIGDWVQLKNCPHAGYIGYITDHNPLRDSYQIKLSLDADGKPYEYYYSITRFADNLIPLASDLHPDDVHTLVDLALATKDKEWFAELVR
jgi:hypothetical protein